VSNLVYILNGPNLNLLGEREPAIYGTETLDSIHQRCETRASRLGLTIAFHQSNHEGVLIDWVQEARKRAPAVIINAAGLTFTSIALLNALQAYDGIKIEIHLSNVFQRESYYHNSLLSKAVTGIIEGFRGDSYELALEAVAMQLARAGHALR
jgi:3-dehydroquinate dehydratase II